MLCKAFLEQVAAACQGQPVRFAVLCGSQAKGCARPGSDYDVGLWVEVAEPWEVADAVYCQLMDQLLGTDIDVDLVVLNHASPLLWREIARDGIVAFEAAPHVFWQFRLRAMKAWEDWKKFHALNVRYRRAMLERLSNER